VTAGNTRCHSGSVASGRILTRERLGRPTAIECLLLGFLLASSLLLLVIVLFPARIEVVFLHGLSENSGVPAKVFAIHHSILAHDECHHAGRPVFRRIGHESETLGHFAVYDVTFRAAWAICPL